MALNWLVEHELEEVQEIIDDLAQSEEVQKEDQEKFKITNIDQLNWAFRKKAAIQAKREEITKIAEAEIQRIKDWLEKETAALDRSEEFFDGLIQDYAMRRRMEDPKFKKEKTPYGSIGFRKQQPKWNYDEEKLIQELKQKGRTDLIRVKEEADKANIKKAFQVVGDRVIDPNTGEVVEGIVVEHREDVLKIELAN